jgi:hypothetical protein
MLNENKKAAIIGLTVIAVFTLWTIIVPVVCAMAIIDIIEGDD